MLFSKFYEGQIVISASKMAPVWQSLWVILTNPWELVKQTSNARAATSYLNLPCNKGSKWNWATVYPISEYTFFQNPYETPYRRKFDDDQALHRSFSRLLCIDRHRWRACHRTGRYHPRKSLKYCYLS